jgi:adenosylmethionine-8-amino-7-oxononanoate aminotransferase
VQNVLVRDALVARCARQGAGLRARLERAFGGHPHVGDIRGRGLFLALELVRDRTSKEPFDPASRLNAKVKRAALDAGLMCYPMGGTIDGVRGDHVLLAPPFIVTDAELDRIVQRLGTAIDAAVAQA